MKNRWMKLWSLLSENRVMGEAAFERIARSYNEPHRAYHTLDHIRACLAMLDDVHSEGVVNRLACEWALWLHDVVYDVHARDSEEMSARVSSLFIENGGISRGFEMYVNRLILATKHTGTSPTDNDTRFVLDIDIHVLGAETEEVYNAYDLAVRREYSWVPWEVYRVRRAEILQGFLDREAIFLTPAFHTRGYETRARAHLLRSIECLTTKPDLLLAPA